MSDHWTVTDADVDDAWITMSNCGTDDEIRAVLESFLARKLAWMPIESAPKDGRKVYLRSVNRSVPPFVGHYIRAFDEWHDGLCMTREVDGWLPMPPTDPPK